MIGNDPVHLAPDPGRWRGSIQRHSRDVVMDKQIPPDPPSSEITPEPLYQSRREFMKNGALTLGTAALTGGSLVWLAGKGPPPDLPAAAAPLAADSDALAFTSSEMFITDESRTPEQSVIT